MVTGLSGSLVVVVVVVVVVGREVGWPVALKDGCWQGRKG